MTEKGEQIVEALLKMEGRPLILETVEHRYTKEEVHAMREGLIELRDAALEQNMFDWAVNLSHVVAVLALVIEVM